MSHLLNIYRNISGYFKNPLPPNKIFFLHIPKCGGTSVHRALLSIYAQRNYYRFLSWKRNAPTTYHLDPESSLNASRLCNMELGNYREKLLLYFMSMNRAMYINGHYNFSEIAYKEFGHEWRFITILRHPVSRWFSHYFFNRYKEHDHFKMNEDLSSFVDSIPGQSMGHFYVYYLTGEGVGESKISDEAVAKAIENLKKFTVVGCLERLDVFVQQLEQLNNIKFNIGTTNINPLDKSKQREQISDEIMEKVEKICQPDMKIYEFALSRLNNALLR